MSLIDTETIFQRIVTGGDVEQWLIAVLRKWSNTYIAEIERQHSIEAGTLARVKGWALGPTFDKWPEDQIPGVLVTSPGLVPPPRRGGDGVYYARWNVQVGCACSARTQQEAHEIAMLFVAAHRAIVLQRPSLEGLAAGVQWLDEQYAPLPYDDTRSLYAGFATLIIDVYDVTTTLAGPATPDDEPLTPDEIEAWPLYPLVETHDEQIVNVETDQPLPQEDES